MNMSLTKNTMQDRLKTILTDNIVTVIFIFISLIGVYYSGLRPSFIINELVTRLCRNSFLVLSLLIPIIAGMGLNFSIVVGAMAGQVGLIMVTHLNIPHIQGIVLAAIIAAPVALIAGNITGRVLNKTKGQEMIASMIIGFFANGIYQLVALFIVGKVIPFKNHNLILDGGTGLRNTIDLSGYDGAPGVKYGIDGILKFNFVYFILISAIISLLCLAIYLFFFKKDSKVFKQIKRKALLFSVFASMAIIFSCYALYAGGMYRMIKIPVVTVLVIALFGLFNHMLMKTKIGQDFRTVGQSNHIAQISGIKVGKIRVLAITISTLLAAWGQIIFLQNIGTINTYGSHEQIGMFSIAALLVGGASVSKATIGQVFLGVILFHTLFIVSPTAGKNIFGDAQIGEYFRAFVVYGVIGISLGLHAWNRRMSNANKLKV